MITMNEVVDGWNRQHVGSNQIGSEERDRVSIDKTEDQSRQWVVGKMGHNFGWVTWVMGHISYGLLGHGSLSLTHCLLCGR